MDLLKIGKNIKAKRIERELTQEKLANMLGVTKAAVSKWETEESYPDITILPQIAGLFHITIDELFGYKPETEPPIIINKYHLGFFLENIEDNAFLEHGTIENCELKKVYHDIDGRTEVKWEVGIYMTSTENDFPYTLQKYIKPNLLIDMYSTRIRLADNKIIDDDKPNKHYVCKEKVWEYKNTDLKYLRKMLKEQVEMGLIEEDDI